MVDPLISSCLLESNMLLAALLLSLAVQPQAQPHITDSHIPDASLVEMVEARAVMPNGAGPLATFDRTYTQVMLDGQDVLVGQLRDHRMTEEIARAEHRELPPPIRRALIGDMVPAFDGGCGILTLFYEIEANTPPRIVCNPQGPR
jgi:hypothetical protein